MSSHSQRAPNGATAAAAGSGSRATPSTPTPHTPSLHASESAFYARVSSSPPAAAASTCESSDPTLSLSPPAPSAAASAGAAAAEDGEEDESVAPPASLRAFLRGDRSSTEGGGEGGEEEDEEEQEGESEPSSPVSSPSFGGRKRSEAGGEDSAISSSSALTAASDAFRASSAAGVHLPSAAQPAFASSTHEAQRANTPQPSPLIQRSGGLKPATAATASVTVAPPHSSLAVNSAASSLVVGPLSAPPFTRLTLSHSADNLSSTAAVDAATAAAHAAAAPAAAPQKVVSRSLISKILNPFSIGGGSSSGAVASPSPPLHPVAGSAVPPMSLASGGGLSPFTPHVAVSLQRYAGGSSGSSGQQAISHPHTPGGGPLQIGAHTPSPSLHPVNGSSAATTSVAPPAAPRVYTYADFAAKMKQPAAQDVVRALKAYVKQVQSPEWIATHTSAPPAATAVTTSTAAAASADAALYEQQVSRVRSEYSEMVSGLMRLLRTRHPLWRGAPAEELLAAEEGIEKFLASKLYSPLFGMWTYERQRDERLAERLDVLHSWVTPAHLDLPANLSSISSSSSNGGDSTVSASVWDSAGLELQNMDRFKSPRDKLVCLLNCCHLIHSILKRAKAEAAAETRRKARREAREKEKLEREAAMAAAAAAAAEAEAERLRTLGDADAAATQEGSNSEAATAPSPAPHATDSTSLVQPPLTRSSSLDSDAGGNNGASSSSAPSSSPSADDVFPALIFVLIHSRPRHLILHIAFIRLLRGGADSSSSSSGAGGLLSGETAYWLTSLEGAVAFLETCGPRSFSFVKPAAVAGEGQSGGATVPMSAEESRLEFERLMARGEAMVREQKRAAAAAAQEAEAAEAVAAAAAATGQLSPNEGGSDSSSLASLHHHHHDVASWTVHGGVSTSASSASAFPPPCLPCLLLARRRFSPRFLDVSFPDLRVADLQDIVREYKEMSFIIQGWQDHELHKGMKDLPLPAAMGKDKKRVAATSVPGEPQSGDDSEGVALWGADAVSADDAASGGGMRSATSSSTHAAQAAAAAAAAQATAAQAEAAAASRGWPLSSFLGLQLGRAK